MKKAGLIRSIMGIIGGAFAFVGYLLFWINNGASALPIAPLVFLCVLLPPAVCLIFGKKLTAWRPRLYSALKWCYAAAGLFYTVSFIIFSSYVTSGVSADCDADVYIVLGCRTNGYTPSPALELRLGFARELLSSHPDAIAVLSGGQGDDESVSEAESMRSYLVSHGIDESRLILEDKSTSTVENLNFSMEIIKSLGLDGKKISAVTSDYHAKRTGRVADDLNYNITAIGAKTPAAWRLWANLVREYMVWIRNGVY